MERRVVVRKEWVWVVEDGCGLERMDVSSQRLGVWYAFERIYVVLQATGEIEGKTFIPLILRHTG